MTITRLQQDLDNMKQEMDRLKHDNSEKEVKIEQLSGKTHLFECSDVRRIACVGILHVSSILSLFTEKKHLRYCV